MAFNFRYLSFIVAALFAASCSTQVETTGSTVEEPAFNGSEVTTATEASVSAPTTTTTTPPLPDDLQFHPLIREIDSNLKRVFAYDELVESEIYTGATTCAADAAVRTLGEARIHETLLDGSFSIKALKADEKEAMASAMQLSLIHISEPTRPY